MAMGVDGHRAAAVGRAGAVGGVGACFEAPRATGARAAGPVLARRLRATKAMVIAALGTPGAGDAAPWGRP